MSWQNILTTLDEVDIPAVRGNRMLKQNQYRLTLFQPELRRLADTIEFSTARFHSHTLSTARFTWAGEECLWIAKVNRKRKSKQKISPKVLSIINHAAKLEQYDHLLYQFIDIITNNPNSTLQCALLFSIRKKALLASQYIHAHKVENVHSNPMFRLLPSCQVLTTVTYRWMLAISPVFVQPANEHPAANRCYLKAAVANRLVPFHGGRSIPDLTIDIGEPDYSARPSTTRIFLASNTSQRQVSSILRSLN